MKKLLVLAVFCVFAASCAQQEVQAQSISKSAIVGSWVNQAESSVIEFKADGSIVGDVGGDKWETVGNYLVIYRVGHSVYAFNVVLDSNKLLLVHASGAIFLKKS